MSRSKDRERAKSGIVFRNGHLVERVEWETAHPTRAQRQAIVDDAVAAQMAAMSKPYHCTKCGITHSKGKIHLAHRQHRENPVPDEEA